MKLYPVYGPHPSRCFGYSLGIDPLLPPKKCPYDCVYCPLGHTLNKTLSPNIHVLPEQVDRALSKFLEINGCVFENVMIWGFGDPLLNFETPIIAEHIRRILQEYGCKSNIRIRTTGYNLDEEWVMPLFENVDEILVPLDGVGETRLNINYPSENAKLSVLRGKIRSLPRVFRDKIAIELNLLRLNGVSNALPGVIDEIIAYVGGMGIRRVYVKTVNRPSWKNGLKPVRGRLFGKTIELIENNGLKPIRCENKQFPRIVVAGELEEILFNHIMRKPLSTDEVMLIYGSSSLKIAERMVLGNLMEKVTWGQKIFFKIKQSIDLYEGITR